MLGVIIEWFLVEWPVWFTRAIAAFLASAAAAYFYVTARMIKSKNRNSNMLWPIFAMLGCLALITVYDFFKLPHKIDLTKVPFVMWLRIVLSLALTCFVWRFILFLRGMIN